MPDQQADPKVSVVTITYNHGPYLRQTLDSFVEQAVDFPVEFIVADDASSDDTPAIITEYAERYPELFRPILRTENVGVHRNLLGAMSAARGEYLALCEGDDYWTDPLKLSRQVAHLDANPEVSVCFHPVVLSWEDGSQDDLEFPPPKWRNDLSLEELLDHNFIQTNSVVYRRLADYGGVPLDVLPLDWYLHVLHAMEGDIAMLPQPMGVYRRHAGGIWYAATTDPERFWSTIGPSHVALFEALLDLFPGDDRRKVRLAAPAGEVADRLAEIPTTGGRNLLLDAIASRPRWAELAVRNEITRIGDLVDQVASLNEQLATERERLAVAAVALREHAETIAAQHEILTARSVKIERLTRRNKKLRARVESLRAKVSARDQELRAHAEHRLKHRLAKAAGRVRRR